MGFRNWSLIHRLPLPNAYAPEVLICCHRGLPVVRKKSHGRTSHERPGRQHNRESSYNRACTTHCIASCCGGKLHADKKQVLPNLPATLHISLPAPLKELALRVPDLISTTGHSEVWGVRLSSPETHVPTQIVLQKYLNANDGDVAKATDQLQKTLEWRAKMKPLDLLKQKFNRSKFRGLGYVTTYRNSEDSKGPATGPQQVFTWNIYGRVKSIDDTFGSLSEFLEWRVALMEFALQSLDISSATEPISSSDILDPYKIFQVHDYKSISFLRQSSQVKTASTETIKVFALAYPELLKEKFFVNVPAIMGFLYGFIKLFVAEKTRKKFHPMSNGGAMDKEFDAWLGKMLPKEYGGQGAALEETGSEPELG